MRVALIAHDKKKPDLLRFVQRYREVLARHQLVATGTTGRMVAEATGLPVHCYLSGPLGATSRSAARSPRAGSTWSSSCAIR